MSCKSGNILRGTSRGGILLEAFLALILIGVGVFLWSVWQDSRGTPSKPKEKAPAAVKRILPELPLKSKSPARKKTQAKTRIVRDVPVAEAKNRSVWLNGEIRHLLTDVGVRDSDVVKVYNCERGQKGATWLENTMVLRYPKNFDSDGFHSKLKKLLSKKNMFLTAEKEGASEWLLEMGDRSRIYMRLKFVDE